MRVNQTPERTHTVYRPPWRVDVVRRAGIWVPISASSVAAAVTAALEAAGAPAPGSVTVVFTDDPELAELNVEHMGIDGATDVLSFPMLAPEVFGRGAAADVDDANSAVGAAVGEGAAVAEGAPHTPPGSRRLRRTHIGDIAISVERAMEQAAEGRGGQTGDVAWSAEDELRLLVTHGTLHLCGWDHAEPDEEAAMRALESRLLSRP
jgi:probable rRNA maturation factor